MHHWAVLPTRETAKAVRGEGFWYKVSRVKLKDFYIFVFTFTIKRVVDNICLIKMRSMSFDKFLI